MVVDSLSRRMIGCRARLLAMGIRYEDEREDVADQQLMAMLVRLMISLTIADYIR